MNHTPSAEHRNQSAFERARTRAISWLHTAQDREEAARQQLADRQRTVAAAIVDARTAGLPWPAIGEALGGIGTSSAAGRLKAAGLPRPGLTNRDTNSWPRHQAILADLFAEETHARTLLDAAVDNTAATIAIARTIGHSWATIAEATTITRQAQIQRLARAYNTRGHHVPDVAKTADVTNSDHQAAAAAFTTNNRALWDTQPVRKAVAHGVGIAVTNQLAARLNADNPHNPPSPAHIVDELTACHRRALNAAVKAVDGMKLADLTVDDPEAHQVAAEAARQAAAAAGAHPSGGHNPTATVMRPSEAAATAAQLNQLA